MQVRHLVLWRRALRDPLSNRSASDGSPTLSVVVAARNEAAHVPTLLEALKASSWTGPLEILLVDDHSEDGTADIARAGGMAGLRVLEARGQGKRAALIEGVAAATGAIVLLTDADCRPAPDWIPRMVAALMQEGCRWVSGPVLVEPDGRLLAAYDSLESQGMAVITAAGFTAGKPDLAQGASIAFRKADLEALGGYAALPARASGDDVLLLQRFAAAFPGQCRFVDDRGAIVRTSAPPSWSALLAQRLRWTSKTGNLPFGTRSRMALVFAASLGVLAIPFVGWTASTGSFLALKLSADLLVLHAGTRYGGRRALLALFPLAAVLHPLLVVISGTFGPLWPSYRWKGRRVR